MARITCANAAAASRYGPDASSRQTKISVDGVARAAEKLPSSSVALATRARRLTTWTSMHRERAQRDQPTGVSNCPRKRQRRATRYFFSAIPATPSIDYFAAASGDSPTDAISGKGPANRMPRRFTTSLLNRLRLIFLTRQAVLLAYKNESQRRLPTALTGGSRRTDI